MKKTIICLAVLAVLAVASCDNGMSTVGSKSHDKPKIDRSKRGMVDSARYVDFTTKDYNAMTFSVGEMTAEIGGRTYKNGNSYIKINRTEETIEMSSDSAFFGDRGGRQFYAKFRFAALGASPDCLYIRRDPKGAGAMIVDSLSFQGDQIPDLAVCLPLYGFSRNRVEVSPVMNGFIAMPSGTYWLSQ